MANFPTANLPVLLHALHPHANGGMTWCGGICQISSDLASSSIPALDALAESSPPSSTQATTTAS